MENGYLVPIATSGLHVRDFSHPTTVAGQAEVQFSGAGLPVLVHPDPPYHIASQYGAYGPYLPNQDPGSTEYFMYSTWDFNLPPNLEAAGYRLPGSPISESFKILGRVFDRLFNVTNDYVLYTGAPHRSAVPGEFAGIHMNNAPVLSTPNWFGGAGRFYLVVVRSPYQYKYTLWMEVEPANVNDVWWWVTEAAVVVDLLVPVIGDPSPPGTPPGTPPVAPPYTVSPVAPGGAATCLAQETEPGWRFDWPQEHEVYDLIGMPELGDVVGVTYPRLGLDSRGMVVTAIEHRIWTTNDPPSQEHTILYRLERKPNEDLSGNPFYWEAGNSRVGALRIHL